MSVTSIVDRWIPEVVGVAGLSYAAGSIAFPYPGHRISAAFGILVTLLAAKARYDVGYSQVTVTGSLFTEWGESDR